MEKIAIIKDTLLNVDYTLNRIKSKELSFILKENLVSKNIDYNNFNKDYFDRFNGKPQSIILTEEVYEYQNFFILEKESGEYILLDGFRRLLWNDNINHDILVRIYKEKDMDEQTILKLLVSLNQTKFFGGIGNFFDRGFALAMFMVFGINITKFYNSFDGYLTLKDSKYAYSVSSLKGSDAHITTLDKISNKNFLDDMRFLQTLSESNIIVCDKVFGSYISSIRQAEPKLKLDSVNFINKVNNNNVLLKQIDSFKKAKDSRGNDIGNKMFEMFGNILLNKEDVKSFVEREASIKEIVNSMKKEKDWFNYTNNKKYSYYTITNLRDKNDVLYQTKGVEYAIKSYYEKNGEYPKVRVVVYPNENPVLKEGVYDDFKIIGFNSKKHLMSTWNIITVEKDGIVIKNNNYNNKYDLSKLEVYDGFKAKRNDIILYIKDLDFEIEK